MFAVISTIEDLPQLIGDKQRLQQVLINLLNDSVKNTKVGKITVSVCYKWFEGMFVVHLRDTRNGTA